MLFKISSNQDSVIHIFQAISIIGFILYFLGFLSMYFWLVLIIIYLFTCSRVDCGIFFLLVGSGLFGRMFASQQLYLSFIVICLIIGITLLYKEIISIINKNLFSFVFLIFIFSFFFIYYLLGPHTDYSNEKITKLIIRGLLWTTTFIIFAQSQDISSKRISVPFLFLSIFYLSQSAELYGVKPSSIYDITYFRTFCGLVGRNDLGTLIVNYHTLAYLATAYMVFWLSEKDFYQKDRWGSIITIFLTFWILVISGTRQTIITFAAILLIRYLIKEHNAISFKNILITVISSICFIFLIRWIGSAFFEATFSADAAWNDRIHRDTITPYVILNINPLTGIGFGAYGLYDPLHEYPHNFFLELLCETGIIGTSLFLSIIGIYFISRHDINFLKHTTISNSFLFPFFVLFFLRAMISGDFSDSISFIAILLSYQSNYITDEVSDEII